MVATSPRFRDILKPSSKLKQLGTPSAEPEPTPTPRPSMTFLIDRRNKREIERRRTRRRALGPNDFGPSPFKPSHPLKTIVRQPLPPIGSTTPGLWTPGTPLVFSNPAATSPASSSATTAFTSNTAPTSCHPPPQHQSTRNFKSVLYLLLSLQLLALIIWSIKESATTSQLQ